MPGIVAGLDLLLQPIALRAAGNVHEGGQPVQGREDVVLDRSRLDVARPADDQGCTHAAFPGGQLAAREGRGAAVGVGDRLGTVVGGEHDDGVVELAHRLQLVEHEADVVVHLLHAGLVDAPVLAADLADHVVVLVRQHGRDVHARRVVPDEERLVGLRRVVAVEEVDDLGRDLLVHRLRALQRQRALVLAGLVRRAAVRGLAPDHRPRRRQAGRGRRVHRTRHLGQARDRRVLARRRHASARSGSC